MNRQEALERLKEIQTILVCGGLPRNLDDAMSEAIAALLPFAPVEDPDTEPVLCSCGGAPLIHVMPYIKGEPKMYHVECAMCEWGINYLGDFMEYKSEKDAVRAWNACRGGEVVSG